MAKNRRTFEKVQREAQKKRKAADKREARQKRRDDAKSGPDLADSNDSDRAAGPEA